MLRNVRRYLTTLHLYMPREAEIRRGENNFNITADERYEGLKCAPQQPARTGFGSA